jgi:hypothetical protein
VDFVLVANCAQPLSKSPRIRGAGATPTRDLMLIASETQMGATSRKTLRLGLRPQLSRSQAGLNGRAVGAAPVYYEIDLGSPAAMVCGPCQ